MMVTSEDDDVAVRVVRSLSEIEAHRWDALTGGNVLASHGWLQAAERGVEGLDPRYVLVQRNGELVAAAACYLCQHGNAIFGADRIMLGRLRGLATQLGVSWLPAIVCCPYRCYGNHLMVADHLPDAWRERLLERLLDTVEELCETVGVPLWFPRLLDNQQETLGLLLQRRYHGTRQAPVAYVDIEWESFAGYVAYLRSFSKRIAKAVRHEINRNRRAGVVIEEIHDPDAHRIRIHDLADKHYFRLNRQSVPYTRDFLPDVKENLGEDVVLYGAFKNGLLIGFSMMLRRGDTGYLPFIGIDREVRRNDFTYFNLGFYRPISDAISSGMKRLYLGTTLYQMKARRGSSTKRLHLFYKGSTRARHLALRPWFAFHSAWMERKLVRLENAENLRRLRDV